MANPKQQSANRPGSRFELMPLEYADGDGTMHSESWFARALWETLAR